MGACRTGMGPPELVISLFSLSVDSGRRQHLTVSAENGPPGSERARGKMSPFPTLWARHCNSVKQPFPLHPMKGPRTFLILRDHIRSQRLHTHTEGASGLQVQRTLISKRRWPLRLVDDSPMGGYLRPMLHLLRLSEHSLKIISDS